MSIRSGRQGGVGLIEVLVAVVLLSIGFLAAARMQMQGMRFSQGAYFQSQANFLAADMIDRMRTNTAGVLGGAYDAVSTTVAVADPECGTSVCDPAEQAQQDIYDWRAHFVPTDGVSAPLLPGRDDTPASGTITALGDGRFRVSVTWSEIIGGEDTDQSLSLAFTAEDG